MAGRAAKPATRKGKAAGRPPSADTPAIRICLGLLGLSALAIGLPASFAPETFYTDYPFFTALVNLLPPYNEHLYLGFGVMFIWAMIQPTRQLVLPLCSAWIVTQAFHFAFHISNLTGFTTPEATIQQVGLAIYILVALIPLALLRRG